MINTFKKTLLAGALALGLAGGAVAAPTNLSAFDVRSADSWAEKLVLCDVTAFLAQKPDLNANRMWVRRDDGHRELLLPPDFVGGGAWYKEGYERLYWRLKRQKQVDSHQLRQAQDTLAHDFVQAYRRDPAGMAYSRTLRDQDTFCRRMARSEGVIVY